MEPCTDQQSREQEKPMRYFDELQLIQQLLLLDAIQTFMSIVGRKIQTL